MSDEFGGGEEIQLSGGSMTTVVRVGDTVRRPVGRWTPAVHCLLRHLEDVGFEGAPRVLGFDGQGREVLTYLPSEPAALWSEEALIGAAQLVRRLHDALADFVPPPGRLALPLDRATGARWPDRSRRPPARQHCVRQRSPVRLHRLGPGRARPTSLRCGTGGYHIHAAAPRAALPAARMPAAFERIARLPVFCDAYGVERLALLDAIEELERVEPEELVEYEAQGISPTRFLRRE